MPQAKIRSRPAGRSRASHAAIELVRRVGVAVMSLATWAAVSASEPLTAEPVTRAPDRHVILVSLDGFANFYLDDPLCDIPTMRRMMREGAVAQQGLECSFPTVTWPNHTTLVTGVPPARHGVLANTVFDRDTAQPVQLLIDPVFDKSEIVKVPTVYDAAHDAGLKTAGIIWPATRNAKSLDWTMPDMGPQELFDKYSTPGWLESLQAEGIPTNQQGAWVKAKEGGPRRDWMYTRATASVLKNHRPHLVLLHLIELDHAQHETGPRTDDARWAVSTMDDRLSDLVDAIRDAGLDGNTTVIVTSDHGFFATEREIRPNATLRELGLIQIEKDKVTQKDAWALAQGGGASVYVVNRDRREEIVQKMKSAFSRLDGVEAVFEPKDFHKIGQATPEQDKFGADLWLAAKDGYSFSNAHLGDAVVPAVKRSGTHGYLPHHSDMRGIFIAWGSGIKSGAKLGLVHNTQVAPTIARLLGLDLTTATGKPIEACLEKP